jgi:aryl-alcohol dehydrogenase-like predicted oxidoreductase
MRPGARWAELVEQGLVRAIGMSNYDIADIECCHEQRPVDVIQDGLSLLDYLDERDKFRRCEQLGIAATVYEPLASGILTGKPPAQILATWTGPWTESGFFKRLLAPGRLERSFAVADGMRPLASQLDATVAQVAIAWVLHQPGVTAAIAGSSSVRHTIENAAAAEIELGEILEALNALVPLGPTFA